MDRHVDIVAVGGIGAQYQSHAEVRTGVLRSVGRRRQQLANIKARLVGAINDFLTGCRVGAHTDGRRDGFARLGHLRAELARRRAKQMAHAPAAREQADENTRARIVFDRIEHHCRPDLRRPHDRSPGTDIAVDTGELGIGVDFAIRLQILTRDSLEKRNRGTEIIDWGDVPAQRMR
jgi:hypothetical protein